MKVVESMIRNLKIKNKMSLLISIFVICLILISMISYFVIDKVKIDGHIYQKISSGKDLIADILPPPEYIIDSYATVLDMAITTDQSRIQKMVTDLNTQKSLYDERHAFWLENLQNKNVEESLLTDSYSSAIEFYEIAQNQLVPMVLSGDHVAAQKIITEQLTPIFETHRGYINQVVAQVNIDNSSFEKEASRTIAFSVFVLSILVIAGLGSTIILGFSISNSVSIPINRLKNLADRLAVGDTELDIQVDSKDEIGDLMHSFSKIIANTNEQAGAGALIANGDLSVFIQPKSDKDIMAYSMNSIIYSLRSLTEETEKLTTAAVAGDLTQRGNESLFNGGFKDIVVGINVTLDGIVGPLNAALSFIEDVANGKELKEIENVYQGQYKNLINHLMMLKGSLELLNVESTELANAYIKGNFSYQPDLAQLKGGYYDIMHSVNEALNSVITPLQISGNYMKKIGNGEIPVKIEGEYPGDFQVIVNSINDCIDGLSALIEGKQILYSMNLNDYSKRVEGTYRGIYDEISQSINGVSDRVTNIVRIIENISIGDLSDLDELKSIGKRSDNDIIVPSMLQLVNHIHALIQEATTLSTAVIDGNLHYRTSSDSFHGAWKDLVTAMSKILVEVSKPILDVTKVMDDIAKGNLSTTVSSQYKGEFSKLATSANITAAMLHNIVEELTVVIGNISEGNLNLNHTNHYPGDFINISNSLNVIIDSLNNILRDINESAEQVSSGSKHVSEGSQVLAQGATEQANTIDVLTTSMVDISNQTKQNAINANQANELTSVAKEKAVMGNQHMQDMLQSMNDINDSSNNISNIIKVIDDIAFQTNILALNAAVEAARAGEHGKGFAVVAEEVRSLAGRSAEAARNTTNLIQGSIQIVHSGTKIANETASALTEIVDGIEKVASLVNNIAISSSEQAAGIIQINKGIDQVSQVVQNNSATSEKSAASSQELYNHSETLKNMINKFQLKSNGSSSTSNQEKMFLEEANPNSEY